MSLRRCHIGDEGCEMISCVILKNHVIRNVNLSQCDLTSRCGQALASALTRQKLILYQDAWMQSLRYRQPNWEAMPGLRRLTLNGNPKLGNSVAQKIIDAVMDSLWFKALDLQNCGLTNEVVEEIVHLIECNEDLIIVDVRRNSSFSEPFPEEIMKILNDRCGGKKSEFRWIDVPQRKVVRVKSVNGLVKSKPEKVSTSVGVAKIKSACIVRQK